MGSPSWARSVASFAMASGAVGAFACTHDFSFLDAAVRSDATTDDSAVGDDASLDDGASQDDSAQPNQCKVAGNVSTQCCKLWNGGCNVVTNEGCGSGSKCTHSGTNNFTCNGVGTGGQGQSCSFATDCKVGYECFGTSSFKCSKLCCSYADCAGTGAAACVPFSNEPYGSCR